MSHSQPQLNEVMSFGEHLEALRWHLFRALLGVALSMVVCLIFGQSLLDFLLAPIRRALAGNGAGALVVFNLMGGLGAFLHISLIGGIVLASPWIIYQVWGFVAPGLYPNECQLVYRSVPILVGLFVGGVFFGWFVALPPAVDFMVRFNLAMGFQLQLAVANWVAFALIFPIAFGLAFELPLAMVLFARIGLASGATFRRHRKLAIVLAAVLSAVLTPSTDPLSMMLMFVPLIALYEAGIWAVWLAERRTVLPDRSSENLLVVWLLPMLAMQLCKDRPRRASF